MQATDDVELGYRLGVSRSGGLEGLFERHGVSAGRIFLAAKGAQAAGGYANIRGIDVAIDVEVGVVAMQALAHLIGQPSHRQDVPGLVEHRPIVGAQALARKDFVADRQQARVVSLESVRGRHRNLMIT